MNHGSDYKYKQSNKQGKYVKHFSLLCCVVTQSGESRISF